MMPVRQLARLNFGTPRRRENQRELSSRFLSTSLALLLVVPWMRDKGKVRLPTEREEKRERSQTR